ncbi:MAG: lamin tail domain-containing protein [Bacteroidota bacterium]
MPVKSLFRFLLFCAVFSAAPLSAQITDDFSDGNFTANPAWQGATANFIVNTAGELQLKAPAAGNSTLAVQGNITDSSIWNLRFRMEFAPSASNLLRIYLLADQADLLTANGYYLEMGENGTADAIRLYRQDAGVGTLLATGTAGLVGTDPVSLKLQVKRSVSGNWTLSAGAPSGSLQTEFSVNDATYKGGVNRFFGVYCLYSATRTDKFFFDDISILPDLPDTQAPKLISASVSDPSHVTVVFDEKLDSLSAVKAASYSINGGVGQPASVSLLSNKQGVLLTLSNALNSGAYTLQTNAIADFVGNVSTTQTTDFQYVKIEVATEFDILINEIMADPSPSKGLPEVEWIELFNRSNKVIDLGKLRIDDGGTPQAIPTYLLQPNQYVVLGTPLAILALAPTVTNVLAVPSFPSLNNDGDLLELSDQSGAYINRVNYKIDWHKDLAHRDGGYTLERINPNTPCIGAANWSSSAALIGGTPGGPNSILNTDPDATAPKLLAAFPQNATTLNLTFSEGLDRIKASNPAAYSLEPSRTISSAVVNADARNMVTLTLLEPLLSGNVYALSVGNMVEDCSGNTVETTDPVLVGLPEKPEFQDIVINEILFNPNPYGARYVEMYNRSKKVFSWENFYLANFYDGSDVVAINLQRLLFPEDYHVFTASPSDIAARFPNNIHPENLIQLVGPSYSDKLDNLTLYWVKDGVTVVVDSVTYHDDWHNALYSTSEREGVALERIRADLPAQSKTNWTSAATTITGGPGTPTLPNSQRLNTTSANSSDLIFLEKDRFSPDDDGYEDFLNIQYNLPASGYAATLSIYDSNGIPVKKLARQELIGTTGNLRWDGDSDDGSRVRPGIYILYFEVFNPTGTVKKEKKIATLVRKF